MGYRPNRKVYVLDFEKHPGLEVRATSISTAGFLEFAELADKTRGQVNDVDNIRTLFGQFAEQLRSWNLEDDDGNPIPATLDGLLSQEFDFVFEIIDGWTDIMIGVSTPLAEPSQDGSQSLVESLPMEALSQNLENSPEPG
jgi:hypothetical protein